MGVGTGIENPEEKISVSDLAKWRTVLYVQSPQHWSTVHKERLLTRIFYVKSIQFDFLIKRIKIFLDVFKFSEIFEQSKSRKISDSSVTMQSPPQSLTLPFSAHQYRVWHNSGVGLIDVLHTAESNSWATMSAVNFIVSAYLIWQQITLKQLFMPYNCT